MFRSKITGTRGFILPVKEFFDAEFSDDIAGGEPIRGIPLQFFPADLPGEADDLRGHLAVQILTDRRHLGNHPGEFEGVGFDHREFFHADVPLEDHGHEGFHLARQRAE